MTARNSSLILPVFPAKYSAPNRASSPVALAYWAGVAPLGTAWTLVILAPAVIGKLLFIQKGQKLIYEFRLSRCVDQGNGLFVQIQHGLIALLAQVAAAQQLKNPVADVGQAQIGDGADPALVQIHFKIVFQKFFPRFNKNWAHSPVNSPVIRLMAMRMGR